MYIPIYLDLIIAKATDVVFIDVVLDVAAVAAAAALVVVVAAVVVVTVVVTAVAVAVVVSNGLFSLWVAMVNWPLFWDVTSYNLQHWLDKRQTG